jgi:predicted GIY-YIG superfamily endonuclease
MKICARCKKEKPLSDFTTRNRKLKNGEIKVEPLCYCKTCNNERATERYYNIKVNGIRFVYRILNEENEIIYVGKTESLPTRTNQHFSKSNSHLSKKAKEEFHKIQFIAMASSALMDIKEIYYINKYKPKYNASYVYDEAPFTISDFNNDIWIDYNIDKIKSFKRDDLSLDITSIFKRKRGSNYLVYIEYRDTYGKKHQNKYCSFENEEDASKCVKELKHLYQF